MKRGVPPTDLKARTGELTPPGTTARARLNNDSEAGAADGYESITVRVFCHAVGRVACRRPGRSRRSIGASLRPRVPHRSDRGAAPLTAGRAAGWPWRRG